MLAGMFLIAGLASLALPGLSTFVSEFLVLVGTFTRYPVRGVIATVGIILAAIYILCDVPADDDRPGARGGQGHAGPRGTASCAAVAPADRRWSSRSAFYPKPVLDVINPAVAPDPGAGRHSTDPVPPTIPVPSAR